MTIENLPNSVWVQFSDVKCISVNDEVFFTDEKLGDKISKDFSLDLIKDNLPDELKNIDFYGISWNKNDSTQTGFDTIGNGFYHFDVTEDNYNKYVKPFADIWQETKDKLDQEQQEEEAEWNKFENKKARALTQLNQDFETAKQRAHIVSSLGFTADANSTANENITGLIKVMADDETRQFCDYYNNFHTVNKEQLHTLQDEIIKNAQNLYNQKWIYRTAIDNAANDEQLTAAVENINFTCMDFSSNEENAE